MAAFKLFSTEIKKAAEPEIVAVLRKAIGKNVAERLIKRVDQFGDVYDYKVQGSDTFALFKSRDKAVEFITYMTAEPILRAYYGKAYGDKKNPSLYGDDRFNDHPAVAPGVGGVPLDQDNSNADANLGPQIRRGTLDGARIFDRKRKSGPRIDGVIQPARKSQRARIL